jgi:ATP-binding cassette, subfamily B, multidrug efflux pump
MAFCSAIFGILSPYFQKEFIDSITGQNMSWHLVSDLSSISWILLAFVFLFLSSQASQLTNYLGAREAVYMQRIWSRRLYSKILSLRTDTLMQKSVGEVVSIYATDIPSSTVLLDQSLPVGTAMLFPLILGPAAIYWLYDVPLIPLLTVIIANVLLGFFMAYRQSHFFFQFKQLAAERIGMVSEWIQNIRTLRILSWTTSFEERIFSKRKIETRNRVLMVTNGQTMNAFSSSITFVINGVTIASVVYLSERALTPGELLSMMWILGVFLTRPFRQLPWMFTFLFDAWTSLQRLEGLFALTNVENQIRDQQVTSAANTDRSIQVTHLNLELNGKKILKNISFALKDKEFVAVVGEVGSGKSMLLYSLMGETGSTFAKYQIGNVDAGHILNNELKKYFSFIPQEGFIMNASLRENVAFQYEADESSDSHILKSLALSDFDLSNERIDGGLAAEIGERGVNLSGGQKQRVSLARVDQLKAPIILMDDCLSAVDVETEEKLIKNLLAGAWSDSTRILVTHRLSVLKKVDRIIFLKEGQLLDVGHYDHLIEKSPQFKEFVATILKENQHGH